MSRKKRHWFWNLLIVVTPLVCALAFTIHYKNWMRLKEDHLEILSGIYYISLPYASLNSVSMVKKIPSMERISGFSAWMKEKGVFRDSLKPGNKIYVFVDDLSQPKIKLVHHDSLILFLNFRDSLRTLQTFKFLEQEKDSTEGHVLQNK